MATTFTITDFHSPYSNQNVQVYLPVGIRVTEDQLRKFPAFVTWHDTLKTNLMLQHTDANHAFHSDPYSLHKVEVQSVDWFGPRIGFVKLKASIRNSQPKSELPGVVFLRGGSVAVLMILRPSDSIDERWVVMTEQPRVPTGSLSFFEIPAGMLDGARNFAGKAAEEIAEETGLTMQSSELIDLTALALRQSKGGKETNLKNAMYPSPGGSDEFIAIFLWEKELDRQEIEDLKNKLTGQRAQGEMITLRVCDYEELWQHGARDAKTLAAWALYEGLNRQGLIEAERVNMRMRLHTENTIIEERTSGGAS